MLAECSAESRESVEDEEEADEDEEDRGLSGVWGARAAARFLPNISLISERRLTRHWANPRGANASKTD